MGSVERRLAKLAVEFDREAALQRGRDDRFDPDLCTVVAATRATMKGHHQILGEPWEDAADDAERHVREIARERGTDEARRWAIGMNEALRRERVERGSDEDEHNFQMPGPGMSIRPGLALAMLKMGEPADATG